MDRLGEPLRSIQVPAAVVSQIVEGLRDDEVHAAERIDSDRLRLEASLNRIRKRMDRAYSEKLDDKIPHDLWERNMTEWQMEEQQAKMAIQGLGQAQVCDRALDAQRILELANSAYSLYVSQVPVEKAKLLRLMFSNFSMDAVSVSATYRKPFDIIFQRAQLEKWSGRRDSNPRPSGPKPDALPDCATPRLLLVYRIASALPLEGAEHVVGIHAEKRMHQASKDPRQ
jgi:site-specific DNA recombinase